MFFALAGVTLRADAFQIETGNPDLKLHWDTTLRYTLADRVNQQSNFILSSPNFDDGERNFKSGIVSNRLDALTEMDLIYKEYYGIRVSAQGWRDFAYDSLDGNSTPTQNHVDAAGKQAQGLTNFTSRYFKGGSAELLDAFVFLRVPIGDSPLDIKLGRHTVYWGESLFPAGTLDGIAYAQAPLDIGKGLTLPGVESKELYRPLGQLSANWQITPTLSLMANYYLEWQDFRLPESGSYLGGADIYQNSHQTVLLFPEVDPTTGALLGLLKIPRSYDTKPNSDDFGVAARWTPEFLDSGTLGFYYRRFSDKLPQVYLTVAPTPFGLVPDGYHFAYADKIDLYGLSLSKNVAGVSVGAELSYRKNMPLNSDPAVVVPNSGVNMDVPGATLIAGAQVPNGETPGARGDTVHGLVNGLVVKGGTAFWDQLQILGELNWDHWDKVTQGMQWFQGRPGRTGVDTVTKNSYAMTFALTPTWFQVYPGVDLSMPFSLNYGLSGNSAISLGNTKGGGTFGYGLSADIYQKYTLSLQYVDFFGRQTYVDGVLTPATSYTLIKDRGFVALTFKTNF